MLPYPVEDLQTLLGRALICAPRIFLVSMWLPEFLYRMSGFHGSHGFHGFYGFYVVSRVSIPHLRLPSFFHGFHGFHGIHGFHGFLGLYWLCVVSIVSTWFPRFLYAEHRVQESSTWDEREVTWTLLPHPTPPIPPECRAQSPGVFNFRWTGRDMNVIAPPHPTHALNAEHRVQESSTWDERDVTWTLLPHPTPPIPPWMQSIESRSLQLEMNGTWHERYCPTPPHPSPPECRA